jgi:hypothetical protein
VEAELSDRALGSSTCINVGETSGIVVGFIRDWLASVARTTSDQLDNGGSDCGLRRGDRCHRDQHLSELAAPGVTTPRRMDSRMISQMSS